MKQIFEMHGEWQSELCAPIQPIQCTNNCEMFESPRLCGWVRGPAHGTSLYALLAVLQLPRLQGKQIKITVEAEL